MDHTVSLKLEPKSISVSTNRIMVFYMSMKSGQIKIIQIAISAHLHLTVLEQRANNNDAQD